MKQIPDRLFGICFLSFEIITLNCFLREVRLFLFPPLSTLLITVWITYPLSPSVRFNGIRITVFSFSGETRLASLR